MVYTSGGDSVRRLVSYLHQFIYNKYNNKYKKRIRIKRWPCTEIFGIIILLSFLLPGTLACGPARSGGRRSPSRKLTPLVYKQHIPNNSENTLTCSGLAEGRVLRNDARFRDLVPNYNNDIVFKDEEGTGADRLMTQRCREKLNTLAIAVMNQWPGVRLRITEGWDEEGKHATDSLHYEGRAVDITTSDRDRSKYGMLARLAVEAGFDWVYYESRSHIHCSVKSESSSVARSGGCFTGNSLVKTSQGRVKPMSDLRVGESVASLDSSGDVVYSEVIAFLDRAPRERRQFIKLTTVSGKNLTLTPLHLVPVVSEASGEEEDESSRAIFASRVKIGDRLLIQENSNDMSVRWDRVAAIELIVSNGIYAPLTREGTIIVDNVVASCYAVMESQTIDHLSFLPLRIIISIKSGFVSVGQFILGIFTTSPQPSRTLTNEIDGDDVGPEGIHWYANFLYKIGNFIMPSTIN